MSGIDLVYGNVNSCILPIVGCLATTAYFREFGLFTELLQSFIDDKTINLDVKNENLTRLFIYIVGWCDKHTDYQQEQFATAVVEHGADIYAIGHYSDDPFIDMVNTPEIRARIVAAYDRNKMIANRIRFITAIKFIHDKTAPIKKIDEFTIKTEILFNNGLRIKPYLLWQICTFL